jgi:hypothetical protein
MFLVLIVLPIALCAGVVSGIFKAISKFYSILHEAKTELFKSAKAGLEVAKAKKLLKKVIKDNTIDI